MSPQGEARRQEYVPGQPRPRSSLPEPGPYSLTLADKGKAGLAGWTAGKGAGKFPYRRVQFALAGTEDEVTGEEKKVTEFISANPKAAFRILDLAAACEYPEAFTVPEVTNPSHPDVRAYCQQIDAVLDYIEENGIVLQGSIGHDEYNGRTNARIQEWLVPEAQAETQAAEAAEETGTEEPAFAEGEVVEEEPEPPAKPVRSAGPKNGAAKPNGKAVAAKPAAAVKGKTPARR